MIRVMHWKASVWTNNSANVSPLRKSASDCYKDNRNLDNSFFKNRDNFIIFAETKDLRVSLKLNIIEITILFF